MAISAVFPAALSCFDIEACEDALIEAIDKSVVKNDAGELCFQVSVLPDRDDLETFSETPNFQNTAAFTVPGRNEYPAPVRTAVG